MEKPMPAAISVMKLAQNNLALVELPIRSLRRERHKAWRLGCRRRLELSYHLPGAKSNGWHAKKCRSLAAARRAARLRMPPLSNCSGALARGEAQEQFP